MKAMILAAGYGTRLRPHSEHTPKPLFPIAGRPLLDRIITRLMAAGCTGVILNTHHLHDQIAAYLQTRRYPVPVVTRYEPEILGTGGGIKNAVDFFDKDPFVVVNGDIETDIDLKSIYRDHLQDNVAATLVLHDCIPYNNVQVDRQQRKVLGFDPVDPPAPAATKTRLAFTGIHVLNPEVLAWITIDGFSSIITTYRDAIATGAAIRARVVQGHNWSDIGTPPQYRKAVLNHLAPLAFKKAFGTAHGGPIERIALAGDGSQRRWFRLQSAAGSLVMADHGIRPGMIAGEAEAFIDIGRHLFRQRLPVPETFVYERFCGLALVEDLGDRHLQSVVRSDPAGTQTEALYRSVIDDMIRFNRQGADGFKPDWAYQSLRYDHNLILEKECRYFTEAFLGGYLGRRVGFEDLQPEFELLAQNALRNSVEGLIHRDMQSRNIMVRGKKCYFIDYQGARFGPLQYDLASLLIDPYVGLEEAVQNRLRNYCAERFAAYTGLDPSDFVHNYRYCALARNLQILGAFGFLSRKRGKRFFEQYIPGAWKTLKKQLSQFEKDAFPGLKQIVSSSGVISGCR